MKDFTLWLKIGPYLLKKEEIRGIVRKGDGTEVQLVSGKELFVEVSYEKVDGFVNPHH